MNPTPFFEFARERHAIYLRRQEGQAAPWTDDPILHKYSFTNVFRELDAVTIWFRENVRDRLRDKPEVLLATVLFRWFNRISTGEAIFTRSGISAFGGQTDVATAWDMRQGAKAGWFMDHLRESILHYCGTGPYVTGAYIIKTPNGMNKLDGVLWSVEQFMTQERPIDNGADKTTASMTTVAQALLDHPGETTLEAVWDWLRQFPYLGDFMAYEIVTDLRHTALLDKAPDIYTWANPGPGAMRGLNRLYGRDLNHRQPKHVFVCEMRELLEKTRGSAIWPSNPAGVFFPPEMRDIEHTLCEFDKYERARLGQGRPRGVYRHGK